MLTTHQQGQERKYDHGGSTWSTPLTYLAANLGTLQIVTKLHTREGSGVAGMGKELLAALDTMILAQTLCAFARLTQQQQAAKRSQHVAQPRERERHEGWTHQ